MGDEVSTEQESAQPPKERRKYTGKESVQRAMADIEDARQRIVGHLETSRSDDWKKKFEKRHGKPLGEMNIAGLSYELISSASTEADVQSIRNTYDLADDVLFSGNLTNFLEDAEHRTWDTIRRETKAFIKGYELAKQPLSQ